MSNKKYLIALFIICTFNYCTKTNDNQNTNEAPSLSISPSDGPLLTVDTIRGGDFGTNPNFTSVYFNGVKADIISSSIKELIVRVPRLSGTGPVTIVTNGKTLT